tara:strand:- start:780 stop:932 length:153 start_codon:yes stop_codon:yes gene_type:complete
MLIAGAQQAALQNPAKPYGIAIVQIEVPKLAMRLNNVVVIAPSAMQTRNP